MRKLLSLAVLLAARAFAQTAAPLYVPEVQYLDSFGLPLANGKLCTYLANTSTPLATYVDSAGTPNTNPVTLDSAGRASLWGATTGQLYKLVLRSGGTAYPTSDACTTGSILWSQDNVPLGGSGGGGGGGGGGGTGSSVLNSLYVVQTSSGAGGTGGYIDLPLITYPSTTCLDEYGNVVNQPKVTTGSAAFQTADAILWNSPSPLAGVNPPGCATALPVQTVSGLNLNTYLLAMGGLATSNVQYNSIQSLKGGAYVKLGYTTDQAVYFQNKALPANLNTPATGYGGLAHQAGSVYYYYNDVSHVWATFDFATGGGGGGGAAAPAMAIQFNSSPTPGTFTGSPNLTYDAPNKRLVNIGNTGLAGIINLGSYMQSDQGFVGINNATPSTPLPYNTFQTPTGGMYALTMSAINFTQSGICCGTVGSPTAGPPPLTTGMAGFKRGDMYWDLATGAELVYNGTAFVSLGGGGGASVGAAGQVQLSGGGGTFAASANFTFASQLLNVIAASSAVAGINVQIGFIQADVGFVVGTGTTYNAINAVSAGVLGRSLGALKYVQTGNSNGVPTLTGTDALHAGMIYYDTGLACERVYDGAAWSCLGTGGGGGVTSINAGSGALTGAIVLQGATNEVILSPVGNTITISTPQPTNTTANMILGTLVTSGAISSQASGSATAFQVANGLGTPFVVDGLGNVSAAKVFASTGAAGGFNVTTNTATNSFQSVGGITVGAASFFNGGIVTGVGTNSLIRIGTGGAFYLFTFAGGAPSCAGVGDGWIGLNTSNQELYVCISGTEYHTAAMTTP